MKVLVGCECSGVVRDAFIRAGHDAFSCDLNPSETPGPHFQQDLRGLLKMSRGQWDMMIGHPPCDFLTNSAAWAFNDPDFEKYPGVGYHQKVKPGTLTGKARREARILAAEFFLELWDCGIKRICLENPIGWMNTQPAMGRTRPQIIQPYDFGEDASKATCLWLKGLPPLIETHHVYPRMVCGCGATFRSNMEDKYGCPDCNGEHVARPRWSNQTDSGQNRLSPSEKRAAERAVTYAGIANAMANQWNF